MFNLFKRTSQEDKEAREQIELYIHRVGHGMNARDEKHFESIIISHEDIAIDIYKTTNMVTKNHILILLNKNDQGKKLADIRCKKWAEAIEFKGDSSDVKSLKSWLSCESDNQPLNMPRSTQILWFEYTTNLELCYLSKVTEFTARLAVYGFYQGYVDIVREPIKQMMNNISYDYAKDYLQALLKNYEIPKRDVILMFSVIYAGPHKSKGEEQLYKEYVQGFIDKDEKAYFEAIETIDPNHQKSIYKKLKQGEIRYQKEL